MLSHNLCRKGVTLVYIRRRRVKEVDWKSTKESAPHFERWESLFGGRLDGWPVVRKDAVIEFTGTKPIEEQEFVKKFEQLNNYIPKHTVLTSTILYDRPSLLSPNSTHDSYTDNSFEATKSVLEKYGDEVFAIRACK